MTSLKTALLIAFCTGGCMPVFDELPRLPRPPAADQGPDGETGSSTRDVEAQGPDAGVDQGLGADGATRTADRVHDRPFVGRLAAGGR